MTQCHEIFQRFCWPIFSGSPSMNFDSLVYETPFSPYSKNGHICLASRPHLDFGYPFVKKNPGCKGPWLVVLVTTEAMTNSGGITGTGPHYTHTVDGTPKSGYITSWGTGSWNPIFFRVSAPSQVVVWISAINSSNRIQIHHKTLQHK